MWSRYDDVSVWRRQVAENVEDNASIVEDKLWRLWEKCD